MSETATQQPDVQDNSVIRELREKAKAIPALMSELDTLKAQLAEISEAKTKLEREKMSEMERVAAELKDKEGKIGDLSKTLAELHPLQGRVQSYEERFQAMYQAKLDTVPAEVKPKIELLTRHGDWPDRLEALDAALSMATPPPDTSVGRKSQPPVNLGTGTGKPAAPTTKEVGQNPSLAWDNAFQKRQEG